MAEDEFVQEELKLCIASLEDELKNVQEDCFLRFFQQGRFALFAEQQQERYLEIKKQLASKEFEELQSREKGNEDLRLLKQGLQCDGYEHKKIVKQGLESIAKLSFGLEDRTSADKIVRDKERMLVERNFFKELSKRDAINNEFFNRDDRHSFEDAALEHSLKCQDLLYDFSIVKQRTLDNIWNLDQSSISDAEIEKLQDYFHGLDQEIKRALDKRREEIAKLKREHESLISELSKASKQNAELKKQKMASSPLKFSRQASEERCRLSPTQQQEGDIENLKLINYELTTRLKTAEAENKELKKQFWSAYRKIIQTAEFKAFLLEEILRLADKEK